MGCKYRFRINHIWSVWYTILMVPFQTYLIYLGLKRYRNYLDNDWPNRGIPHLSLNVYLILYYLCLPVLLLFAIFGIFKSGNLAGDNEKLGARTEKIIEFSRPAKRGALLFGEFSCFPTFISLALKTGIQGKRVLSFSPFQIVFDFVLNIFLIICKCFLSFIALCIYLFV